MNNADFGNTMENVRKHRDLNLSKQKEEENIGVSIKLSYYKTFHRKVIEKKKTQIYMNKTVYL